MKRTTGGETIFFGRDRGGTEKQLMKNSKRRHLDLSLCKDSNGEYDFEYVPLEALKDNVKQLEIMICQGVSEAKVWYARLVDMKMVESAYTLLELCAMLDEAEDEGNPRAQEFRRERESECSVGVERFESAIECEDPEWAVSVIINRCVKLLRVSDLLEDTLRRGLEGDELHGHVYLSSMWTLQPGVIPQGMCRHSVLEIFDLQPERLVTLEFRELLYVMLRRRLPEAEYIASILFIIRGLPYDSKYSPRSLLFHAANCEHSSALIFYESIARGCEDLFESSYEPTLLDRYILSDDFEQSLALEDLEVVDRWKRNFTVCDGEVRVFNPFPPSDDEMEGEFIEFTDRLCEMVNGYDRAALETLILLRTKIGITPDIFYWEELEKLRLMFDDDLSSKDVILADLRGMAGRGNRYACNFLASLLSNKTIYGDDFAEAMDWSDRALDVEVDQASLDIRLHIDGYAPVTYGKLVCCTDTLCRVVMVGRVTPENLHSYTVYLRQLEDYFRQSRINGAKGVVMNGLRISHHFGIGPEDLVSGVVTDAILNAAGGFWSSVAGSVMGTLSDESNDRLVRAVGSEGGVDFGENATVDDVTLALGAYFGLEGCDLGDIRMLLHLAEVCRKKAPYCAVLYGLSLRFMGSPDADEPIFDGIRGGAVVDVSRFGAGRE